MSIHYYTVIWLVIPVREEVRYEAKLNELGRKRDTHSPRGDSVAGIHIITGRKMHRIRDQKHEHYKA